MSDRSYASGILQSHPYVPQLPYRKHAFATRATSILVPLFSILILLAPGASAQYTQVSGTILDPQGVPYSAATIKAQIVLPLNFTGQPTVPNNSQSGCISAGLGNAPCRVAFDGTHGPVPLRSQGASDDGHFVIQVEDTSQVLPASSQWLFTVSISPGCVEPWGFGPRSFTYQTTITGSSVDLSSPLSAIAPLLCRRVTGGVISGVSWFLNNSLVGIEPGYDVIPGTNITITATDDPGALRVHYTINSIGGGVGCTLPGVDTGVLSEHPPGTCFDSTDWLWNDTLWNDTQGDGTNVLSLTNTLAFTQGTGNHQTDVTRSWATGNGNTHTCDANTIGTANCHDFFDIGRANSITDTGASSSNFLNFLFGESNSVSITGGSNGSDLMQLLRLNAVTAGTGGTVDDIIQAGTNNTGQSSGASSITSSLFQIGETNSAVSSAGANTEDNVQLGENNNLNAGGAGAVIGFITQLGFNHSFTTNTAAVQMNYGFALGHANLVPVATSTMTDFGMVGHSLQLLNCTDCYAIGKNITQTAVSNTLFLGMSASDIGLVITNSGGTHDNVRRTPMAFASLPSCAAGTQGSFAFVTDSTTTTYGATITGGSSGKVWAVCDGTNWTVH